MTKLTRGWIVDGPGGTRFQKAESESQQLPDDPFAYQGATESSLVRPLHDLELLVRAQESNSLHARCVKQKASDILGRGVFTRPTSDEAQEHESEAQDRWGAFVRSVEEDDRGDGSLKERLTWSHEDYEGTGWAVLEVSRDREGTLDGLWYVPGHTVRPHVDNRRYAQKRGTKTVWFKRFGIEGTVDRKTGAWSDSTAEVDNAGNELLVIRNHTPRSSYYGTPDHVPALAALAGWQAQAQFNLKFFDNLAVPSYAVVIEGAEVDEDLEQMILEHFRNLKGEPSKTLILPIPGAAGDEASAPKVRFEQLSVDVKDASHRLYKQDNALEICIAHGMPPYRVGWPIVGSLGGATAVEMTEIYLSSMVQPRQETWEQRLTRAFCGSKGLDLPGFEIKARELDTREEMRDLEKARLRYLLGVDTPKSIARFLGAEERDDPSAERYIDVPLLPGGMAMPDRSGAIAKGYTDELRELAELRKRVADLVPEVLA